jgi:hypothetical protein
MMYALFLHPDGVGLREVTMKKTIACITVGLSLILLAGCQGATAEAVAEEPCEFEEGSNYCVSPEGDVYFDTIGHRKKTCEVNDSKNPPCDNPEDGLKMICVTGDTWGFCTDEEGKVDHGDSLPFDVCGNGTNRAPCYEVETVEEKQYREPFRAG